MKERTRLLLPRVVLLTQRAVNGLNRIGAARHGHSVRLYTALSEDVSAFAATAGTEVEFERVVVTPVQVGADGLPTAPPNVSDRRSCSGTTTTQAEALQPDLLATLVRAMIERRSNSTRPVPKSEPTNFSKMRLTHAGA